MEGDRRTCLCYCLIILYLCTEFCSARLCFGGSYVSTTACTANERKELRRATGDALNPVVQILFSYHCDHCAGLCALRSNCFSFNYESGIFRCLMYAEDTADTAVKLVENDRSVYAEQSCLCSNGPVESDCTSNGGKELQDAGGVPAAALVTLQGVASCTACGQQCLEVRDACRSFQYNPATLVCRLQNADETITGHSLVNKPGMVYGTPFCDNRIKCHFGENIVYSEPQPGKKLSEVATVKTSHVAAAANYDACKVECTKFTKFPCLSFNFKQAAPTECRLNPQTFRDAEKFQLEADVAYSYSEVYCACAGLVASWVTVLLAGCLTLYNSLVSNH